MKRIVLTLLVMCAIVVNVSAQQTATVKSMTRTTDHIAGADRRKDLNGKLCALVKVQVLDEITRIEGNKIGKIVDKGVEKWVYMCKGSRNMRIHLKNHLPLRVVFQDYQITSLESNRVYELVIDTQESDAKQKLVINYTPANATVMIDTKIVNGNGRVELELPVGEHSYTIAADGYVTAQATIKLTKEAPREITEKLVKENASQETTTDEQTMSTTPTPTAAPASNVIVGANGNLLNLKVKPFYARIKIDGVAYEADGEGELTVPLTYGTHKIDVEADGYAPHSGIIDIKAKKSGMKATIKLSEEKIAGDLKFKKGTLVMNEHHNIEVGKNGNILIINPKPKDGIILHVDGVAYVPQNNVEVNSLVFFLPYGSHEVNMECEGYVSAGFTVNIGQSAVTRKVKLEKIKEGKTPVQAVSRNGVVPGQNGSEVVITVKPIYATVTISGVRYSADSKGSVRLYLPYGMHRVQVEANGFYTEQATITVGKKTVKEKIKLKEMKD